MLILDDDVNMGRLLARAALGSGMEPMVTTTVQGFRAAYETAIPRVIILDLQLGADDGVAQLRYLAEQKFPNELILVSGFDGRVLATAGELARNQGLRIAGVLAKPIDITEFHALLGRVRASARVVAKEEIEHGLRNREFVLEYQPIVHSRTGEVHNFEAVLRWNHPTLGFLLPDRFVGILEENPELAIAVTEYVVGLAVSDQLVSAAGAMVPVAVNVSPSCLRRQDFSQRIENCLSRHGVATDRLCIEITGTTAFEDTAQMIGEMTRLRLKGIQVTLDNFGTAYSSPGILRRLPFSMLKMDRALSADVSVSKVTQAVIRSIVVLAKEMGIKTIAEGVETSEMAVQLAELGVGFLQGSAIRRLTPAIGAGQPSRTDLPGEETGRKGSASETPALSPRQTEVMRLIGRGLSVKQCARRMNLSVGTVKTHLSLAYTALGTSNRIEALRLSGCLASCSG